MALLSTLLALITQHPRGKIVHGVDFEWSTKSWTHNLFRFIEMLCGRRVVRGTNDFVIRKESSFGVYNDRGKITVVHQFHTWESAIAHIETLVREFLKELKPVPIRLYVPQFITPQGFILPSPSPFLFAIARDAVSNAAGVNPATSVTVSHTCTGSNLILMGGVWHGTNEAETATYNAIAMTSIVAETSGRHMSLLYLTNPATGANNLVFSWATSTAFSACIGMSYTGAKQTGQMDSFNTGTQTSGADTLTVSTTVVASNCWLTGWYSADGVGAHTAGAGTSINVTQNTAQESSRGVDSNAEVGTGAQSLAVVYDGAAGTLIKRMIVASIAPAVAGAIPPGTLALMGVGM